jgi:hypothetical protein
MPLPQCARKKSNLPQKSSTPQIQWAIYGICPRVSSQAPPGKCAWHHRLTFYFPLAMVPVAVHSEIKK